MEKNSTSIYMPEKGLKKMFWEMNLDAEVPAKASFYL